MKIQFKSKLLITAILLFISDFAFSQSQRILNTDTLVFMGNKWNYKTNGSNLMEIDSSVIIVKFNSNVSRVNIISFLQSNHITLIDSLYEFKLCKLNSSFTFSRSIDAFASVNYFESYSINHPAFLDSYPNDLLHSTQMHISNSNGYFTGLDLQNPWAIIKGNPEVVVAVIDAFPDWSHIDIGNINNYKNDNIWENKGEDPWLNPFDPTTGDKIDNDKNGFIDDWKGWNFFESSNNSRSNDHTDVHGTNVMGVIAAKSNNNMGVTGIAGGNYLNDLNPELGVQILPINIFSSRQNNSQVVSTNEWYLAEAIEYAAASRANIIALSLSFRTEQVGTDFRLPIIEQALDKAKNKYGCLVFCSAGNDERKTVDYPAYNENVYAVGGLNIEGTENPHRKGDYARGKKLSFVALAERIGTTTSNNSYVADFGQTSASSPQVSGVAALLLSYNTCLTNNLIYEVMKLTGDKEFSEFPDLTSYIYDNNTNSNLYGYGMPSVENALELIDSYTLSNYTISSNTTWTGTIISNQDIIVQTGNTLTISGYVNMAENTKIIVQAGANLTLLGAEITGACGWEGIKVYGIANQSQNLTSFGKVYITNNTILSSARIGVESINGGIIVSNTGATFRNNKSAIVIKKHTFENIYTEIKDSYFISDGNFLSRYNKLKQINEGIKEFINLNNTDFIQIKNCTFENTADIKLVQAANAINAYSTNYTVISNCVIKGMFRAIDAIAYNGLLNTIKITDCEFNDNLQCIRIVNSTADIANNTFNLPFINYKYNNLFSKNKSYGIYSFGSINYIHDNKITCADVRNLSLGIVVRNSRALYQSYVDYNDIRNVSIGTQLEQYNKQLQISCNSYTNINKHAWSLNPQFTVGNAIFPMQGSELDPLPASFKRAGNLFYDRDLPANSLRHIKSSFAFTYNAANSPIEAVPEYNSLPVIVSPFFESNATSCAGNLKLLCKDKACSYDELLQLLNITQSSDSVTIIKQSILNILVEAKKTTSIIEHLNKWNTDQSALEVLLETLISNKDYTSATTVFHSYTVHNQRDQDYFDFYTFLLTQLQQNIPSDSLTETSLTLIQNIAERNNDVSDLAKAFLSYHDKKVYAMLPEDWEGEGYRITKNTESTINKDKPIENNKISALVYPNPSSNALTLVINSGKLNNEFKIEFLSPLGQKVLNLEHVKANTDNVIDVSTLPSGVYYVNVLNESGEKLVKRISILR